jgi:hypothetical protein
MLHGFTWIVLISLLLDELRDPFTEIYRPKDDRALFNNVTKQFKKIVRQNL